MNDTEAELVVDCALFLLVASTSFFVTTVLLVLLK